MKSAAKTALLAVMIALVSLPALAETSFSFSVSDGYRSEPWRPHDRYRYEAWRPYHHWHRPPPAPIYYAPPPVYIAPRPVVYQTTIVQPASVAANQTSPTFTTSTGQLCREYQSTGWVAGSPGAMYGTACLQPDGSWRVVN